MGQDTKIEWATHTFNPWEGCTKVSPGCANCYAEARNHRYGMDNWGKGKPRRRTSAANWKLPLKWNREAVQAGMRPRVFCASLADVFDEEVADEWRADLFELIDQTKHLDWLLLTKRPQNIVPALERISHGSYPDAWNLRDHMPNVWLGTTVENQDAADKRIPFLLEIPAAVRFLSCEPLLGTVDLSKVLFPNPYAGCEEDRYRIPVNVLKEGPVGSPRIHWVIAGGESGPNARPMHPDWARSLRDQCIAAGVPFFLKQWGEWIPQEYVRGVGWAVQAIIPYRNAAGSKINYECMAVSGKDEPLVQALRVGKKKAGRWLDARSWDELPEVGVMS